MSEKFNIESPAFGVGLPPLAGGNTWKDGKHSSLGLTSSFHNATYSIMGVSDSWPTIALITSQSSNMQNHWHEFGD
jgi:hypothetical protein